MTIRTRRLLALWPGLVVLVAILVQSIQQRRFDEQFANRRQAIDDAGAAFRDADERLTAAARQYSRSAEDLARLADLQNERWWAGLAHMKASKVPIPQRPWPWLLPMALILGFLPVWIVHTRIWYLNRRRRRRRDAERCVHCGYDVRATPQRCPECGNDPIDATPQKSA